MPCIHGCGEEALSRCQAGLCRLAGEEHAGLLLESTAYSIETERLRNIDVDKITRLIIVDNRNPNRLGKLAGALGRPGVSVHLYDHHPRTGGTSRASKN